MIHHITEKGKEALSELKRLADERGLDLERREDRAQMWEGVRPDIQEELRSVASARGWVLGDVVAAAYVETLLKHYRKVS